MRTGFVVLAACVALSTAGCVPKHGRNSTASSRRPVRAAPVAKPVAATARPFSSVPIVSLVDTQQTGPMYRVQIVAEITRDVMPTDDLAIVITVGGDHEVGRYPIVGRFERTHPTRIKQEIELPLGDYEIEYDYQGTRFSGMPFRFASVPVWGGRRSLQIRQHPGTRVSLREKKLWVGRWWANDGPPQAWIVEWAHEGKVVTATSGREEHGIPTNPRLLVGGAAGAFQAGRVVENSIWTYGEEYAVPDVVATKPGPWAARVVHGASAPISIVFNVLPNGRLSEASSRRVQSVGWEESWSKKLEQRALSVTEVDRLTAKLPQISSTQPFDDLDPATSTGPEAPVRITTAAVRALFRSKQLADAWWAFENLNVATPPPAAPAASGTPATARNSRPVDAAAFPKTAAQARKPGLPAPRDAATQNKQSAKEESERRAKIKALRSQIESLIKSHGGPWKSDEFPRS